MTLQLIYVLGLASMAGAHLGGLPSNQMTVAVSGFAKQVLLNTTGGAEATASPFVNVTPTIKAAHRSAMLGKKRRNALIPKLPAASLVNLSHYKPGKIEPEGGGSVAVLHFGSPDEESCTFDASKQLGSGGFGSVYACVLKNGSELAAKFIEGPDKVEASADEFRLQNKVNEVHNDHVVEAKESLNLDKGATFRWKDTQDVDHQYVIPDMSRCIVMEKLDFELWDLTQKIKGNLIYTKRTWIQVLQGVEAVHEANIIWRDLKIENILCTSSDPSSMTVKITDFGLAVEGVDKKHHELVGTPQYMAPKMVQLDPVYGSSEGYDASVDAWALGVLLYELYFGVTPFVPTVDDLIEFSEKNEVDEEIVVGQILDKNILSKEVEFTHSHEIPEAPFQMKDLIRKCLDKDPRKRPKVHPKDLGYNTELISSHPWVTGDKTQEQQRLTEWLAKNEFENAKDFGPTGQLPLHLAVEQRDVEMVEILVMNGSPMDVEYDDKTPKQLAIMEKLASQDPQEKLKLNEIVGIFDRPEEDTQALMDDWK